MTRLLKLIFITLGSLFLVGVLSLLLLLTFINPNHFKTALASQVQELTARNLVIQGNLKWSFFPWLGIEVNDASLSNPKGFTDEAFAELKKVNFYVKFLPLLKKQVQIGQIQINDANLNLIVKKNGENNWQDLLKNNSASSTNNEKNSTKTKNEFNIIINKLIVNNATIKYTDLQNGQSYVVEHFNLKLNDIKLDHTFPLTMNFVFKNNQNLNANIHLSSKINVNENNLTLTNFQVQGKMQKPDMVMPANFNMKGNSQLNLKTESFNVSELYLQFINLQIKTHLHGEKIFSGKREVKGEINVASFNVKDFLKYFGSTNMQALQASATSKLNINNNQINFNNLVLQFDNNKITGNAKWHLANQKGQASLAAKNIKVGELVKPIMDNSKLQLTGTGDVESYLSTSGVSADSMLKNLNGHINFAVRDGALEGINIKQQFDAAYALIKKQSAPSASEANRTSFGTLTGTINLSNGVAINHDLLLKASDINLTGQGSIDLNQQRIDYQIKATLTAQNLDKKVQEIQQYIGGSLPIRITGSFQNYRVYPDISAITEQAAKSFIDKHSEKLKEKVTEEVNKQIEKVGDQLLKQNLKNLFQ